MRRNLRTARRGTRRQRRPGKARKTNALCAGGETMTLQPTTVKIDADAIRAEFETFSKSNGKVKVFAHSEILAQF